MCLNDSLDDLMKIARKGREIWRKIKLQYSIGYKDIVYFMPHIESEINNYAMLHSEEHLKLKHANRLVVITIECLEIKNILKLYENICIVYISEEEMHALLKYNDMTTFSSQVDVSSLQYGSDCNIENLLKYEKFTKEELVCIGLLGLPEYEEVKDEYR